MELLPHHDGSALHVSASAPSLGDTVEVRLRVPDGYGPVAEAVLLAQHDHEPGWARAHRDGSSDGWDWWSAPLRIGNPQQAYRWMIRLQSGGIRWLNQAGVHDIETRDADDFVVVAGGGGPSWLRDAVVYQIFPDRFARSAAADDRPTPEWAIPAAWDEPVDPVQPGRSHQLYGGDLDGVVEHLDHLEALGVDVVYLTPFFPAGSNHRYDAASFDRVDPLLGGDDALVRLVDAAHARGMRVIGDLTTNHSGDRHDWFTTARGNAGAATSDFYYFTDDRNDGYVSWLGYDSLPKLDWSSEGLKDRFVRDEDSAVRRWLRPPVGLDGWRIDVANMTGRMGDLDHNADVRRLIRDTMRAEHPDALLIAEITNDPSLDLDGAGWQGAMTYPGFTRPLWSWLSTPSREPYTTFEGGSTTEPWFFGQPVGGIPRYDADQFARALTAFGAGIPWSSRLASLLALDTHDTARFASNASDEVVAVALGLSMTLPGLPLVYAGDEFGARGADGELARTPMAWGTEGDPPVAERLALYRELIGLRRAHRVLGDGGMRWLHVDERSIVFVRESAEASVLVLAATGDVDIAIDAPRIVRADAAVALHGDAMLAASSDGSVVVSATGPVFAAWALPGVRLP